MTTEPTRGDPDSAWWWEALADGELLLPKCTDCDHAFFPPMPACPECGSTAVKPVRAVGSGRLYSWVVVHQPFRPEDAGEVPFTIVAVDLDEGGRVFGRAGSGVPLMAGARLIALIEMAAGGPRLTFAPTA